MGTLHPGDVGRLGAVIELVALYHPAGLLILLGERPPLDAEAWSELIESLRSKEEPDRVDRSPNLDGFLSKMSDGLCVVEFIERACGWGAVVESAQAFRQTRPMDWNIFVEFIRSATDPLASRLQESPLTAAAGEYGVDRKTIYRRRSLVPVKIAREAIGGFQRALFG